MKRIMNAFFALLCVTSLSCFADWSLKADQSQLYAVSVKNAAIAEVHHFSRLDGKMDDKGQALLVIDLASIETQIPVRNERMNTMFFDTANFASANISTQVDVAKLKTMKAGEQASFVLPCLVQLHGKEKQIEVAVNIVALVGGEFQLSSAKPIVLSLADFELVAGVQALQEIAKLNSIAVQVPVMFTLVFAKVQ